MSKLTDIDIERVDGVDEPATHQKFLILKAEEPEELRQNVKELLGKVEAALKALAKNEGLMLSKEAAESLNAVAKALDLGLTFKAYKPGKEEEEDYGYPEPDKDGKKPAKKDEGAVVYPDVLAKAIAAALSEQLAPLMELSKASGQVKPASRQAQAQDTLAKSTRKLGEGLFTDIVFGGR